MVKKYIYSICKCGSLKETPNRPYCKKCCSEYYKGSKKIKEVLPESLDVEVLEFIEHIESRRGMASLNEIFVDLIDYYTWLKSNGDNSTEIDILPPMDQIKIMWMDLIRWKKNRDSKGKIK